MAQYPIALSNLAAGLVNSAGDPEALVIQYPENYPRRFTEAQLNPILIPRHQGAGGRNLLPGSNTGTTLALPIPDTNIVALQPEDNNDVQIPALYKTLKVNDVPQAIVNGFCQAVERAVAGEASTVEFITSILSLLARRAGDVPYEAWNTRENAPNNHHHAAPLGTQLRQLANDFPPPHARAEPHGPTLPNRESNKGFKITLVRLLSLLFGVPSSPFSDVRLWLLAAQLVTLAMNRGIRNKFAIRIGSFMLTGAIDFGRGAGGGGGSGGGSGGGAPPNNRAVIGPAGAPGDPIPWGRVARVAGMVALGVTAVAPAVALGPVLGLAGFTAAGPAAASFAAFWQSCIGIVEAGSLFSMLTSIGMAGAGATAGAPLLAAVGATAGAGAGVLGIGLVRDAAQGEGTEPFVFHFSVTITIVPVPQT